MRRIHVAALTLALVALTAGCIGAFSGISEEQLCEDGYYDYDTDANATYDVRANGTYTAVYNVSGTKTLKLFETGGLGSERPLTIRAIEFRARNGTTYGCDAIDVETTRRKTIVTLPAKNGKFAYTADASAKRFTTRTFVEGSHEVVLPEGRSVSNPVFGGVSPGGSNKSVENGRLHIEWGDVDSRRIVVQYYMDRDIPLFLGVVGIAGVAAAIALAYHYRLLQRLEERRRAAGIDVDVDDDDRRDPPPGMG